MSVSHGWYGDPAIWAAAQLPDQGCLGVVLCTPFGQEGVIAYRGLRLLADRLQARHIASIRYDPPGRGDAAPSNDPQAPFEGARRAAEVLRLAGCTRIAYLGLSSAALVAAEVADDLVVLWSPPASGRAWLRKARALATMELGAERSVDGIESLIGLDLTHDQAEALNSVTLAIPESVSVLAALRTGQPAPPKLDGAEVIEVTGTAEFLDTTSMASVLPVTAIDSIVDWLASKAVEPERPLTPPPLATELDLGTAIERIRWIGPHQLFAIECSPSEVTNRTPMVLLHAGGSEHRVGAGDYQVELARLLAVDGARSIRSDRRAAGETGVVSPDAPTLFYSGEWVEDQDALIAAAGVPGDRLALTGLCAGGWLAGQTPVLNPRLVVAIHPLEYRIDPARPGKYVEQILPEKSANPIANLLRSCYLRWAPVWLRRLRDRYLGRGEVGPFLDGTSGRSWRTVLIFSDLEKLIFTRRGGPEAVSRLDGVELVSYPSADHAMYARKTRLQVISEIRRQVAEAFDLQLSERRDGAGLVDESA
jgi:hypothetical protein